jgi:hypothetical protein
MTIPLRPVREEAREWAGNQVHTFCDVGSLQSKAWNRQRALLRASSAAELVALRLPARGQWRLEVVQYERIAEDRFDDVGRRQCPPQGPAHLRLSSPLRLGDLDTESFFLSQRFFLRLHHLPQVERHKTAA